MPVHHSNYRISPKKTMTHFLPLKGGCLAIRQRRIAPEFSRRENSTQFAINRGAVSIRPSAHSRIFRPPPLRSSPLARSCAIPVWGIGTGEWGICRPLSACVTFTYNGFLYSNLIVKTIRFVIEQKTSPHSLFPNPQITSGGDGITKVCAQTFLWRQGEQRQ